MRLLDAAFAVVSEDGYARMTARSVSGRAGVSNKTFYDLFADREDCFLAAFDQAIDELVAVVLPAWESEKEWATRIRAGLCVLLGFLDCEPGLCRLVFVEALAAGPRVLARRSRVLEELGSAIDEGRTGIKAGRVLPPLTAEGVVGAAFGVIHARVSQEDSGSLLPLVNPLMATVVLPYRGHAAAARELKRSAGRIAPDFAAVGKPARSPSRVSSSGRLGRMSGSYAGFRPTQRTQMVLAAVAELGERGSNPSNREVSDRALVTDQGQISKLLSRLQGLGLLENTGGETQGFPRAWQLTPRGEEVLQAAASRTHLQVNGTRETR